MVKITIDNEVLKLTPRGKKLGKRLLWGWLSLQIFTLILVLGGFASLIVIGIYTYYEDLEFDQQQEILYGSQVPESPSSG